MTFAILFEGESGSVGSLRPFPALAVLADWREVVALATRQGASEPMQETS